MKRQLLFSIALTSFTLIYASDYSGTYLCTGYDTKLGAYGPDTVILSKIDKHSYPNKDLYSYKFELKDLRFGDYVGNAVSNGNALAVYYANTEKSEPNDKGLGVTTITNDIKRDKNGKFSHTVSFDKFYLEPTFVSDGSEHCIKKS
jgi:hypothetical protein